ncbi:MAG: flagellar filament capping protein FliD, partial [Firmicutes bacterium]|nr:flagellar filament capping protein FliD [Bacillota bacterium]
NTLKERSDAWRELNSRLYKLKDAVYNLQSFMAFRAQKVTVSDEEKLTATASAEALLSSYQLNVKSLAKAHSVASDLIGEATTLSGGRIQITINGESKEIELAPEGSSNEERLNSIARQINQADSRVTASVIKLAENQFKLYLTSKETGTVNQMELADVGGDSVLRDLGILDEGGVIAHEAQAATDAEIEINGDTLNPAKRASNRITDLIPGVTLNLKEEGTVTLGVELDQDKIVEHVKGFVNAYNSVMDYINQHKTFSYNESTKSGTKGALFGDSALLQIESRIKEYIYQTVEGVEPSVGLLSLIGIKSASGIEGAKSGRLEFDEELFRNKLESNFDDIVKLFGATSGETEGIFTRFHEELYAWTSTDGVLKTRSDTIQKQISDLDKQVAAMEDRLAKREEYYYARFMAMEKALATIQSQSAWMSAQLAALSTKK